MEDKSAAQQIDSIIKKTTDWRGTTLSQLRTVIRGADTEIVEEVKWKKPSKPEGVAVWSYSGNICMADILKNAVRLTFPKGALVTDPRKLFNARLDSKSVRAVDVREGENVDETALQAIVLEAAKLNSTGR